MGYPGQGDGQQRERHGQGKGFPTSPGLEHQEEVKLIVPVPLTTARPAALRLYGCLVNSITRPYLWFAARLDGAAETAHDLSFVLAALFYGESVRAWEDGEDDGRGEGREGAVH